MSLCMNDQIINAYDCAYKIRKGICRIIINETDTPTHQHSPSCYVSKIFPYGVVGRYGDVRRGDQLLSVNGVSVEGESHTAVVPLLKDATGVVKLILRYTPKALEYTKFERQIHQSTNSADVTVPTTTAHLWQTICFALKHNKYCNIVITIIGYKYWLFFCDILCNACSSSVNQFYSDGFYTPYLYYFTNPIRNILLNWSTLRRNHYGKNVYSQRNINLEGAIFYYILVI